MNRRVVLAIAGALLLLVALGGVALATRSAAVEDFAPVTMRITWWTSAAIERPGLPTESGTAVQLLEYRNINSWKLTVESSSWDPGVVGMSIEVNRGIHSTFYSQIQRLVSTVIPANQPPEAPLRWLIPGLINALPQQGFAQRPNSANGTVSFIENDARFTTRPDGTIDVQNGTIIVFDRASRLPLSVKTYGDGALRESFEFTVLSRP